MVVMNMSSAGFAVISVDQILLSPLAMCLSLTLASLTSLDVESYCFDLHVLLGIILFQSSREWSYNSAQRGIPRQKQP